MLTECHLVRAIKVLPDCGSDDLGELELHLKRQILHFALQRGCRFPYRIVIRFDVVLEDFQGGSCWVGLLRCPG
ncbi:hypothetical protein D3C76_1531890 [compost metagenome]